MFDIFGAKGLVTIKTKIPVLHLILLDTFQNHKTMVLQGMSIENLIIMGMQSEFCVDTTCRRAFSLGYNSILVSDAHSTFDNDVLPAEKIIQNENRILGGKPDGRFVKLKTSDEVVQLIYGAKP